MAKTSTIRRKKLTSSVRQRATKRLMRDLQEIYAEPLDGIAALPLEHNIFVWHANLKGPKGTPWEGGIFHIVMNFPETYPDDPPTLTLATRMEHPNVFGNTLCLDMLQKSTSKYEGWSPAYTVQTILIQLQAFLFEADVNRVLENISNPKDYEKRKQEWLSAVKWSVEQSIRYQDKSVGHHPPAKPWPAFVEPKEQKVLSRLDIIKQELVCFYTKQTFEEDCMGVGISYSKNLRTGEIKSIQSPLDIVSLRAFMNHKLRTSSVNQRFSHWLPIYINAKHAEKAMHLAKRALSIICTGTAKNFKPEMVLKVFPKLMSTMVVEVMSGKVHASIKALYGYCQFHRMFLMFVQQYPELRKTCEETIEKFIKDENYRHKDSVPNLGEFLPLLTVTDYRWDDIKDAYLDESFTRSVFWILNKYPELEQESHPDITDDDRLKYSFEVAKVGSRLLYFHVFFLNEVAHPTGKTLEEVAKIYDDNLGRPAENVEDAFTAACEKIWKLGSYEEFFAGIGMKVDKSQIVKILMDSIKKSKKKGYHGTISSVLSPEEFAKKNKAYDLQDLIVTVDGKQTIKEDEKKFAELCNERWGYTEIPDYLQDVPNPWRSLYLQNNLQDLVQQLNDVPDFKLFHNTLDLSSEHILRLECQMFNPTSIKSRYFFLTSILTKLKKLETLIIKKGETGLGVKGFKALIKGLSNNPGCLKSLILEYCDVNADAIKELTKGKLVSKNLQRLVIKGNPLHDQGAINLADFLRQHQALPHLTELDLSDCKINSRGAQAIAEALLVKKELKILRMIRNPLGNGLDIILKNLSYVPTIKQVDISRSQGSLNNGGTESLAKLLQLSISLEELNLWKISGLNLDYEVFRQLKWNKTLKKLDLAETGFNKMKNLGEALAVNRTLEELQLENNSFNGTDLFNMYEELKRRTCSLKVLNLNKNNLSSVHKISHKRVIGDLLLIAKQLRVLTLDECRIDRDWMDTIGEALHPKHNLPLKELSLRGNKIGKYGLKPLVNGLSANTTLEKLNVSGADLGVLGGKYLASILEKNTGLKEVNAFGNFIEIEGAEAIAEALKKNKTLKSIDLGLNRIRVRGALAIAKMLAVNTTLEKIGLKHNRIPDKTGMELASVIIQNKNSAIKSISFAGNYLSVPIRSEIALMFQQSGTGIEFDLAKLVEVKDPDRQSRTIYITPLPNDVTEQQIKKLFYSNKCGAILSVSIHSHKIKTEYSASKFAFVEFAHPDSIQLAMQLVHKKKNKIGNQDIRIARAGVQNKHHQDESSSIAVPQFATRGRGGIRIRGRGGVFRGRGGVRIGFRGRARGGRRR